MRKLTYFFIVFIAFVVGSCRAEPLTVVIFGATGDLSARKLFPALYNLDLEKELPADFTVVGIGKSEWDQSQFQKSVEKSLHQFSRTKPTFLEWEAFKTHLVYQQADFTQSSDYASIKKLLEAKGNKVFYLATPSVFFTRIIELLHQHGLVKQDSDSYARVIIEKPFGEDLDSALALQGRVSQFLDENQIYRMDHYLGKEGVFKLEKFRFEDAPYESYLNGNYVKDVQITLSETIGIGTRADFYEKTGHLRDVIQNHAMQILAYAAMEMPESLNQEEILKEKAKALYAIKPLLMEDVIRAQYAAGIIKGEEAVGYLEEAGVPPDSRIETFMHAKMFIQNARWDGVPFYIRSGKRLAEQLTEVRYNFKDNLLGLEAITVVIQPNPRILVTRSGLTEPYLVDLNPILMRREGYENTLLAAIQGDMSRFVMLDEVLSTWELLTPVLNKWVEDKESLLPLYKAGTWGPEK